MKQTDMKLLTVKVSGQTESIELFLKMLDRFGEEFEVLRKSQTLPNAQQDGTFHVFLDLLPANSSPLVRIG